MQLSTKFFDSQFVGADALKRYRENEDAALKFAVSPEQWLEAPQEQRWHHFLTLRLREERRDKQSRELQDDYGQSEARNQIARAMIGEAKERAAFESVTLKSAEDHDTPPFNPIGRPWNGPALDRLRKDTTDDAEMQAKGLAGLTTLRENLQRHADAARARSEVAAELHGVASPQAVLERDALHQIQRAHNRTQLPYSQAERKDRAHREATEQRAIEAREAALDARDDATDAEKAEIRQGRAKIQAKKDLRRFVAFDQHGNRLPPPDFDEDEGEGED